MLVTAVTEHAKGGTKVAEPTKSDQLRDMQGGLIGFNKDFVRLMFFQLPVDPGQAKALIGELIPQLTNAYEVLQFNGLYKEIRHDRGGDRDIIQATWLNLWLSREGLSRLGVSIDAFPEEFKEGMTARADALGDVGRSLPASWEAPFTTGEPDAVLYLSADAPDDLSRRHDRVLEILSAHGVTPTFEQPGTSRPDPNRGREHFGFKDGISQPGIHPFTTASKIGPSSVPAGEFIIGYEDATGHISGQPVDAPPPAPSGYNPLPTPPPKDPLPEWMHNASFVVYRKLQQDVGGFRDSMTSTAPTFGITPDQLGAKVVGRWPSGAPMEHVPGEPKHPDPSEEDPSATYPDVLKDEKINNFNYDDDPDGQKVPRAAHIRKVNPRSETLPEGDKASLHRMLRRGIPYGSEFVEGSAAYGQTVDPGDDRGLLFITYQASIERSFEFVQRNWVNQVDFQQPGDGADPIASQATDPRPFSMPPDKHADFKAWVFTRGGGYFVSLALSGLNALVSADDEESSQ